MSNAWLFLIVAGLFEVVWAVGLKYTARLHSAAAERDHDRRDGARASYLLARALRTIPVGTGYAVWTGIGAVGTALVGIWLLGEPRSAGRLLAIAAIVGGIVGLKMASPS